MGEKSVFGKDFVMESTKMFCCSCGCNAGMLLKKTDDELIISFSEGSYYIRQEGFFDRLRRTFRLVFSKNKNLIELVLKREDIEDIREFLEDLQFDTNTPPGKNEAFFRIEYDADIDIVFFSLECDMGILDLLRGREYRCYEICYNKKQTEAFIRKISSALEAPTRRPE